MRIVLHFLVANVFVLVAAQAQEPTPVKNGSFYGFESGGKMVIAPQFRYATHFRDGLALVQEENKWGYISTAGAWVVPATYDAAQPMNEGKAVVFQNGKMGLVSKTGKVLLQPVYDNIEQGWNENYIYKDGLKGLCDTSWTIVIEPMYTELNSWPEGYNCHRTDGLWDIYARGKKIAEGLTRPAYSDYSYNTKNVILEQKGKVGIYDLDKGWLIKAEYDTIFKQDFYEHKIGENSYRFLYILDRDKYMGAVGEDVEGLNGEPFRVAFADGRLVSDHYYTWIYSEPWGDYQSDTVLGFRLHHSEGTTYLTPSLRKFELPYGTLARHRDYYIATRKDGRQDILRSDMSVMASYASVRPYSYFPYVDPETGEVGSDMVYDQYLPVLLVAKEALDRPVEALYFLTEEREITPFLKEISVTPQMEGTTDTQGYIYGSSDAVGQGFFFPGMDKGTDALYSDISFHEGKRVLATKDDKRVLYEIRSKELVMLASAKEIIPNQQLITYNFYGDSDMSEPSQPDFNLFFFVLRDENGKLGLLAQNSKVLACQFDSIIQNASMPQFVDGLKNGKYTAINVQTGEQIFGSYDQPLTIVYNDGYNYYYAFIEQAESSYYVDKRGKFFSVTGEFYPFKENGKMGAKTYSEFSQSDEQVVVIAPVFKSVERSHVNESFIEVKNTAGLLGVLNPKGDTVIPILYKELKPLYLDYNQADVYQTKTREGALGLASPYKGVIIPAVFDSWEELYVPNKGAFALLVRKGDKRGLYSYDGVELLPCIYDEMVPQFRRLNDDEADILIIVKKDGKWFVYDGHFGYNNENQGTFGPWSASEISKDPAIYGPFDFVINGFGYRVKTDGAVAETSFRSGTTRPAVVTPDGIMQEGITSAFFVNQNLIGVKEAEEEYITVLEPQFSYIEQLDSLFCVAEGGECFILSGTGKKQKRLPLSSW